MGERCDHRNTDFDRTFCPEPCGMFHTYCQDCGECLDECAHAMRPTIQAVEPSSEAIDRAARAAYCAWDGCDNLPSPPPGSVWHDVARAVVAVLAGEETSDR